jgi:nitrite reductase/ring-hydroxylating ferredoxin subunit/DMSO/TMAO reductase YedYZ heme-binding membrane subunit
MSVTYRAVGWNPQKRRYDLVLGALLALYLVVFTLIGLVVQPNATVETQLIRAFATAAFLLLHVILSIGPLCRLDRRFLPLLYNRRHLGVTMCLLATAHGSLATFQFHALSDRHPVVSVLTADLIEGGAAVVPFQPLGFMALAIIVLMGATSHDFWLRTLTPPVWKSLHMLVYLAWMLLVAHVAFGLLQSDQDPRLAIAVAAGVAWILGLHLAAARRERAGDRPAGLAVRRDAASRTAGQGKPATTNGMGPGGRTGQAADGAAVAAGPAPPGPPAPPRRGPGAEFVEVCRADEIPEGRARVFCLAGERVAVFRYGGRVSALSNVCQHQNGPLGEGRIVNGCVVCPWHGYEYRPEDGASPPPFTERVPTFRVAVREGRVFVDPRPLPAGTAVSPALIER